METRVLALSSFLQTQLSVLVETAEFFPGGGSDAVETPCSLVTIEPFAPGGLRRLVLNVWSPLIRQAATALHQGKEQAVILFGKCMIRSGSWFIPGIDGPAFLHWKMARGLIATPTELCVWPVPHHVIPRRTGRSSRSGLQKQVRHIHTPLAIWPLRVARFIYDNNSRGDPTAKKKAQPKYLAEIWDCRDRGLAKEWKYFLSRQRQVGRNRRPKSNVSVATPDMALVTYAPSLPCFLVAEALAYSQRVPQHMAFAEAADWLLRHDRLFCLSLFFGVPLIDRTGTLKGSLRTAQLCRPPPDCQEVGAFLMDLSTAGASSSPMNPTDCHSVLRFIMLKRARELWAWTEDTKAGTTATTETPGDAVVAWSGGIDSTAVLCALLETASEIPDRMKRLKVVLDTESIAENPSFYRNVISGGAQPLAEIPRSDQPLSWHANRLQKRNKRTILITGELGDQLFGSDRCRAAFPDVDEGEELPEHLAKIAPRPPPPEYQGIFHDRGLGAPWEETILPSLNSVSLISNGDFKAWKDWISPQLKKSPFPIHSTFDFLWWINFSMKWQTVMHRCLHDGGTPLIPQVDANSLTGCVRHFYDDRQLECWSCVQAFHNQKFADLSSWKSYKEPLKFFVLHFDGNAEFYREKMKIGSLCFDAPSEPDSYVNRFYGAVVDLPLLAEASKAEEPDVRDLASQTRLLSWGVCGMASPTVQEVKQLLQPNTFSALEDYPNGNNDTIHVDPWNDRTLPFSPFDAAPYFAEEDERQRRTINPVTKITLTGKCAALLAPDVMQGHSLLDLGACLGASSYWALCVGASHVTAVEAQESFCARARILLERAQNSGCWSTANDKNSRPFEVVHSGMREYLAGSASGSHDVILAAGVLHCFVDPIQMLVEMARVASFGILIEMTHPGTYVEGNLEDPDEHDSAIGAERNEPLGLFALPYPAPGGLKAAVRPAQRRVEASGLMQVAPRAAVNMADHDASFKGLAVLPSRIAIETLMKSLGFSVSRVLLKEHPTKNEDVATYTGPRKYQALSKRYFLRCFRETKINAPTLSLESLVLAEDQSKTESWQSTTNWFSFNGTKNSGVIVSDLGTSEEELTSFRGSHEARMDPTGKWEFDATIAQRFEREARCHIPDYEEVVDDAIRILERELQEKSLQKGEVKALDVGCATGHTIIRMLQQGFHNVHGVDLSSDMLSRARERLKEAGFEHASASNVHLSTSPLDLPERLIDGGKFDAVFVNWTLQFVVDETERKLFLQNIGKRMASGALIVLTEKTVQNKETKDAYYAFKRRMGVSEREIVHKEERLKGVLEPLSTQWYLDALSDCGFTRVSVFRAKYGFVTFVARRGGAHIENDSMAQPPLPPGDFQTWNLSASADNIQHDAKEELAPFSTRAWGSSTANSWVGGSKNGTVYGYVHEGPTTLTVIGSKDRSFTLWDGMYFASAGSIKVKGGSGVLQLVDDHRALFAIGGPVEEVGRLPYIDGCTDTLLLAPAIKGAPCLNHLHFPANVIQTQHTHPSGRSGVVVSGRGACVCQGGKVRTPLAPGVAFVIPANVLHAFETEDQELDVVAFHPDSDSGPTADDHPMVNRTMVDGVSASQIDSIRTKDTQAGLE